MSRDQQRLKDYLEHIIEAIGRIEQYIEDIDELEFIGNELIQDAVIRNLEVIGEASRNIEKLSRGISLNLKKIYYSYLRSLKNPMSNIVIEVEEFGKKYLIKHEEQERYKAFQDI